MGLIKDFLKHYFWTSLLFIIIITFPSWSKLYNIFFDFFYFIIAFFFLFLKINFIFVSITFLLNKIFRLEVLIALLIVILFFFIDIYIEKDFYVDYADKIDFDNTTPKDKYGYYIGKNGGEILSFLFLAIINLGYCIFFGKNKFYSK